MRNRRARRQRGIALVLVLWVLSLLTIMALSLTTTQRSQHALAQNQIDGARFRALADGAVALAMLNLLSNPGLSAAAVAEEVWVPDGSPRSLQLAGETIELRIYNQASRIDINSVERHQLLILLELASAEPEQLDTLADAILDWRDSDQLTRLHGAEDDFYQGQGHSYGAADQPFESTEELLLVRGMTRALYRSLAPDLRAASGQVARVARGPVFGSSPRVGALPFAPAFASARALAAMQNITLEEAQMQVSERHQPALPGVETPALADRGGPEYLIRVTATRGDFIGRALEVLVRAEPRDTPPYDILWRREGISLAAADAANPANSGSAADD